ncbi:uncharacterized protein LOC117571495 isoform X1 [Drosophila albomicans]|uniref:Uncharacterized protein LOC117571495 isoform X1 n=1 Tax=Drosophila albomicans TaxID=7291 RepID=A0A6P8YVU1_DROAB|nr:uncharacterized protein LOC117571495 isoform X1 [Drosophila albomicans]
MTTNQLKSAEQEPQEMQLRLVLCHRLAAWRALNEDYQQVQTIALEFRQWFEMAAEKIECFEQVLKQRKEMRDEHIQSLTNAGEISRNWSMKYFQLQRKHKELRCLRDELLKAKETLRNRQLQLELVKRQLLQQTIDSHRAMHSLKRCKAMNVHLRERNLKLETVSLEVMELYRCRALMLANQTIDMEQELIAAQSKSQVISDVSNQLQSNIKQIQLRESRLIEQLAKYSKLEVELKQKAVGRLISNVLYYLRFLWECVSSLSHYPQLKGSYYKFQSALAFL